VGTKPPAAGRGRPKGAKNKASAEIKDLARRLLNDKSYRERFATRLNEGELPPAVECMLYHYAYGKPAEQYELPEGADGVVAGPYMFIVRKRDAA
jgi:hypothetical protein